MNQKKELKNNPYITKAYFKLWNVFLNLVKNEKFLKEVEKIRKDKGIILDLEEIEKKKEFISSYDKDICKLCEKYNFDPAYYCDTFYCFVFYNKLTSPDPDIGLCEIVDIFDPVYPKGYDERYPISIRISPDASLRDIQEFVKKQSFLLERLMKKYKDPNSKIGKLKGKNQGIQERNDLIWKNRKLPTREIFKIIYDRFDESLDLSYINKIIILENKKRKEV
ncbi:MAG: hypothetical protein WC603_04020 [Candidatus Paceibacterota bacterium]